MSCAELTAQAHAAFTAGEIDSAIELYARALEDQYAPDPAAASSPSEE
jgi:hypothetical protein